jgi:uncharacterized protein
MEVVFEYMGAAAVRERKILIWMFFCFYAVWAVKEFIFIQSELNSVGSILIKLIVWVLPVLLYLRYFEKIEHPFAYLKMNDNIFKGTYLGLLVSFVLVAIQGALSLSFGNGVHLNLGWRWMTTPLFALPEELLFRGFILQKICQSVKQFRTANSVTSLLFVSIHFPRWFFTGLPFPKIVFSIVTTFAISYGLGYVFKKSNSLWSPAIVHTVYNLLLYTR